MSDEAVTARPAGLLPLAGAVTLALALSACDRTSAPEPAPKPVVAAPAAPAADPVLDRAAILTAIDAAASDAAAGRGAPAGTDPLADRRFRLRIAFGCQGPTPVPPEGADDTGAPGWSRSGDARTVRLRFTPADWTAGGPAGPAVQGFESVGGVWINQPWIRTADCPAAASGAAGTPGTGAPGTGAPRTEGPGTGTPAFTAAPTVGLALLRAEGASRLGRDDSRAFTYTVRGEGDAPAADPVKGYRLVLEGRLTPWAGGRVIRCAVTRAEARPTCVAGVIIDHLAYEDGVTGETLGEWRPG